MTSEVTDFLKNGLKGKDIKKEYEKFTSQSRIESFGEEDYVIKEMMLGKKPNYIIKTLNMKYPDVKFGKKDITDFLDRHRELTKYFKDKNNKLVKRHLAARTEVEEELANMALFCRNLITKYDSNNDSSATIAAIKALNTTIMNYSKIAGMLEAPEKKETKNIINIVSERHEKLANKLLGANFDALEVEGEVVEDEEIIEDGSEDKDN